MKNKSIIFGLFILLFSFNFARAANMPPIFITQIQITGGKDNTSQDFVELFNPNESSINLKGYRLVKRAANAQSDTLMKSWSKDTFIPAKSFYLWANSGYTTISAKPDAVSSATISADSGVALRFGSNDTGTIVSNLSWGKTNNGFINVSSTNPGANQAIERKDLYATTSAYSISASMPHNSLSTDLSAAFEQSQETQKPVIVSSNANPADKLDGQITSVTDTSTAIGQVEGESTISTTTASEAAPMPFYYGQNQTAVPKSSPLKYLILSVAALLALILLVWKSVLHKK